MITILSDEAQGLDAMRVCIRKPSQCCNGDRDARGDITTPMRMLIEEMPGEIHDIVYPFQLRNQ